MTGIIQHTGNDFFRFRFFPQARLVRQCLFDADGFDPLDRDQFGKPINLPIGHLQNATNVPNSGFGQERAEGDDLGDAITAVFLLDILDHFLPAIHAKVDIKIRHRHAFGVEEPFEQQRVAQWVKISDGQCIGNQRTSAGTAPRPNRNILILGPFNEIRNDQEVAGKSHTLDHAKFKIKPRLIFLNRHRMRDNVQSGLKALVGGTAQFFDFVIRKFRQDRVASCHLESASTGDFNRVFNRFWQVGKQRDHFCLGFEIVLLRQMPTGFLLIHISPI